VDIELVLFDISIHLPLDNSLLHVVLGRFTSGLMMMPELQNKARLDGVYL